MLLEPTPDFIPRLDHETFNALVELHNTVAAFDGPAGLRDPLEPPEAERYRRELAASVKAGRRFLFMAFAEDGSAVSSALLEPGGEPGGAHRARLEPLLVHPAWRDRSVGRRLVELVHNFARTRGVDLVWTLAAGPLQALGLDGMGYVPGGTLPGFARTAVGEHDAVVFYRWIVPRPVRVEEASDARLLN